MISLLTYSLQHPSKQFVVVFYTYTSYTEFPMEVAVYEAQFDGPKIILNPVSPTKEIYEDTDRLLHHKDSSTFTKIETGREIWRNLTRRGWSKFTP